MAIDGGRSTAAYSRFAEEMDIDSDAVEVNTRVGYNEGKMDTIKSCFMMRWKLWAVIALCMLAFLFGFLITHIIVSPCKVDEGTPAPSTIPMIPSSNTSTEHHEGEGRKYIEKIAGYINVKYLKSNMEQFTEHDGSYIHDSGSAGTIFNAQEIKKTWGAYGFNVTEKKYTVQLTRPAKNKQSKLQILYRGEVSQEIVPGATTQNQNLLPPFCVNSPSIGREVDPVFINYGTPEDFHFFVNKAERSFEGAVCVFKLGMVQTPLLVRRCAQHGGIGVIAFPDPEDYASDSAYPEGRGLPPDAVIRDFASPLFGDPRTPSLPSLNGVPEEGNIYNITTLPTLIISYGDAANLLSKLGNPPAPHEWIGGLPSKGYFVGGPGLQNGTLKMIVANEKKDQEITNIFATIRGSVEPDRYVILGCHRDSLTAGAVEPGSGMAVFMELSRLVSQLISDGWTPRRTIIFASWDGGDDGHIGSTEWVEENKEILNQRAVVYINLDEAVAGNATFAAEGSAIFAKALRNATQQVKTPDSTSSEESVFNTWQKMNPEVGGENYYQLEPLGVYTDATPFLHIAGVPSVDLKYTYNKSGRYIPRYPLWHTSYDTIEYVETMIDPSWNVHKTMADIAGHLLVMYADDIVLPVDVNDYASTIESYVVQLKAKNGSEKLAFDQLDAAVRNLKEAAEKFHDKYILQLDVQDDMKVREANDRLVAMERAFLSPNGQTNIYPQLRHMIYGPSSEGAYEGEGLAPLAYALKAAHGMPSDEKWNQAGKVMSATVVAIAKAANALVVDELFT